MLREVVSSSSLRSIGYDAGTGTLEVEFTSGSVYRYAGVPRDVWVGIRRSASKGKYFQEVVRDRYEAEKVA
jgi:hypothetical protein